MGGGKGVGGGEGGKGRERRGVDGCNAVKEDATTLSRREGRVKVSKIR